MTKPIGVAAGALVRQPFGDGPCNYGWCWTLSVNGRPLTDVELIQVRGSIERLDFP